MSDYERMTWNDLQDLRAKNAGDQQMQQQLAPFEHRAYARESVAENPLNALKFAFMIPGYQAAKVSGILDSDSSTTPASLDQLTQGFAGVSDGLQQSYTTSKNKLLDYVNSFKF